MINIDLTGQTAIVTGASRGIGLAVTRALADCGARAQMEHETGTTGA